MKIRSFMNKFVLIAGLIFACQAFAAWDGTSKVKPDTAGGYYIIDTEAKLAWYGANYNSGNAKLTADLDLGGHLWIPLAAGKGDKYYSKIFDGQNHIIKNLYVNGDELSAINKDTCDCKSLVFFTWRNWNKHKRPEWFLDALENYGVSILDFGMNDVNESVILSMMVNNYEKATNVD